MGNQDAVSTLATIPAQWTRFRCDVRLIFGATTRAKGSRQSDGSRLDLRIRRHAWLRGTGVSPRLHCTIGESIAAA